MSNEEARMLNAAPTQWVTIKEAALMFGISADTIRRGIKREQDKEGSGLIHEVRRSAKGSEYFVSSNAIEAAGYKRKAPQLDDRTRVEVSTKDLEVEQLRAKVIELANKVEVQTLRADFAAQENQRLKDEAERANENLRIALTRMPRALPPAPPSIVARVFGKRKERVRDFRNMPEDEGMKDL